MLISHDAELIGIGCPVFENRPSEIMTDFLKNSNLNFNGKKVFVFITSGGSPAKSLVHLSQAVNQTGATVIGGIQVRGVCTFPTLFGIYPERPNEEELNYAEKFGRDLARNCIDGKTLPEDYKISPNIGDKFYNSIGPCLNYIKKKTTPPPKCDSQKCNLCGICKNECPTDNISIEDKSIKFGNSCIVCYRCWHVCPPNAILMKFSPGNGLTERLVYSEKMERLFGNVQQEENVGSNLYKDVLSRKIKLKYNSKHPTSEFEYIKNSI